jgi:hypothetical protein
MNHFAGFDRYVVGERNEGIRREVQTIVLQSRLRENDGPRSDSRLTSLFPKRMLPLLRRTGLAVQRGR